jgi:hypothetical protein
MRDARAFFFWKFISDFLNDDCSKSNVNNWNNYVVIW